MKLSQPSELMDMTNIIREYVNRKKPAPRKLDSNVKGATLVLDMQAKRRPLSSFKSYETLETRPRAVRERLLSKQSYMQKSRERNQSANPQLRLTLQYQEKEKAADQNNLQNLVRIKQPSLNRNSFRIIKPRSKFLSNPFVPFIPKKHCVSLNQPKIANKLIRHRYWIEAIVRRGLNSTVYKCNDTLKETQIALKMFNSIAETNELKFLKYLEHPNLIKYHNYFIDDDSLYFTMELYNTNLFQYLSNNKQMSRQTIKDVFKQICEGINHLHNSDYAHTNLKLEHVLVNSRSDKLKVVIIDFSHMIKCKDEEKLPRKQIVRNPNYASPELVGDKPYNPKSIDCWALGIILYALLTGRLPFRSKQPPELERKIKRGKLCFPQNVNEEERQLIRNILNIDASQRHKIRDILNCKWLN